MVRHGFTLLALALLHGAYALAAVDPYSAWRADAARILAARGDANSLVTAAALTSARGAATALELAVKASELAPQNPAIGWLRLQLCTNAPGCDIRDAATTMRWVDADNGAAWLPTLTVAQKDKDTMEVDRVLAAMAEGTKFNLYGNRITLLMFGALKRARNQMPKRYLDSDAARLIAATDIANAVLLPPFSPLINACREAAAESERHQACLTLAKTMQRADVVMAQLVGFSIERRLSPSDGKLLHALGERRRLLEWRVAEAARYAEAASSSKNFRARSRIAIMRAEPREEDVSIAILRKHNMPLEPPEDH